MNKLLLFVLLSCTQCITAQGKFGGKKEAVVEPKFPGGTPAFYRFVETNFKPNNGKQQIIVLEFIVEKTGMLSNIKIVNPKNTATEKEAIRVMKRSPNWIPATAGGKPVRCRVTQKIKNPNLMFHPPIFEPKK